MIVLYKLKNWIQSYLPKRHLSLVDLNRNMPISNKFGFDRGLPIDRYYIDNFLYRNKSSIKGIILELSENVYAKKFHSGSSDIFRVLSFDNSIDSALVCDLSIPSSVPDNYSDCFICTQTLNFIFDVESAVQSCYKILKNGGVFLGTVSGLSQISEYDMIRWGDYWRFTDLSVKILFEKYFGTGNVEIFVYGNLTAALCFLQGMAVEDLPSQEILDFSDKSYQLIIGIKAKKILID